MASTRDRWACAVRAAAPYDGVLSRTMLRQLGVDRAAVRRGVASLRWAEHGKQTVALHTAPLSSDALRWRAVWEVGIRIASLDGVSALQAIGLNGFTEELQHVSIAHACRPFEVPGVTIHRVRRWSRADLTGVGAPRVRADLAAVRAAHWAVSDRQAALILCLAIQQRLVTPSRLAAVARTTSGGRARLVTALVGDLAGGVQSLGELDFAHLCRRRGLPEPTRQVVRRGPRGRIYLDVGWEDVDLYVEIDGAQHRQGLALVDDNLRQNAVTMRRGMVLRIGVIGLRIAEDAVMNQVVEAHRTLSARSSSRAGV